MVNVGKYTIHGDAMTDLFSDALMVIDWPIVHPKQTNRGSNADMCI